MKVILIIAALFYALPSFAAGDDASIRNSSQNSKNFSLKNTYPRADGIVVKLKVLVTANGNVSNVEIYKSSGDEYIDDAAMNWARTQKMQPTIRNGEPVEDWFIVPLIFNKKR